MNTYTKKNRRAAVISRSHFLPFLRAPFRLPVGYGPRELARALRFSRQSGRVKS
jgi:hypothetical protein